MLSSNTTCIIYNMNFYGREYKTLTTKTTLKAEYKTARFQKTNLTCHTIIQAITAFPIRPRIAMLNWVYDLETPY